MAKMNGIDLRNEFALLQNNFSYDILYNRTTRHLKCRCFQTVFQSGIPDCPVCHGQGYATSLQRQSVIPTEGKSGLSPSSFGEYAHETRWFYMSYEVSPAVKDLIIETGWSKEGYPVNPKTINQIESVYPMRGDSGRIEYWKVKVNRLPDLLVSFRQQVNQLPVSSKRKLANGERFIWPMIKK